MTKTSQRKASARASRQEAEIIRRLEAAEVIITLAEEDGGVNLAVMPRDETPNAQSLAVVLASFIHSNLPTLTKAAVQAKLQSEQQVKPAAVPSVTTPGGGLAKAAPLILGPDGRALQ